MLAFVLSEGAPALVQDRPRPAAGNGLVRVRTLVAGICNTGLELARGYMGFRGVLGHEFVGIALDGAFARKRVVGGINFGCATCSSCRAGLARHCADRRVLGIVGADGALAEEFVIPECNLVEVPESLADETAAFAEPVAAACEILEQIPELAGRRALVVGDGKLGPMIAQVLASEGADVTLEGRHLESLSWLQERGVRLGASEGLYEVVVEATGSAQGLAHAIEKCVPRATLVLKTTNAGKHEIDLASVVINEITIVGSRCGRLEPALERLADGRVSVASLVSQSYELPDVERAFAAAAERGVRKVLVRAS
jgi:threonine dehydrogenase-like Zn-dependent dehydrogenase